MSGLKVVCLSDTHLRRGRGLPGWCRRALDGADLIVHARDLVSVSVLEELERLAPVEAVVGNMDDAALRQRLPARRIVEIAGVRIGLVHDPGPAIGRSARLMRAFPSCGAIVTGHTHVPGIEHAGPRLILNPGSPTRPRAAMTGTMIRLTISENGCLRAAIVTP